MTAEGHRDQVYSKDAVWTVKGDEGVRPERDKDVTVTGNVVVSSNDGLRSRLAG